MTSFVIGVQEIIERHVRSAFPDHDFLGEESVPPGPEESKKALEAILKGKGKNSFLWICDPIDGTTNFVHGLPLSAISIGVAHGGEVRHCSNGIVGAIGVVMMGAFTVARLRH